MASARLAYSVLFTVSLISAWVLRDHGAGLMSQISWVAKEVKGDPLGQHQQFYGAQAVYRVSIGSALFFMLNAAVLYKVKLRSDPRDRWLHHGSWFVKFPLWLLCCVLPFLLPNGAVEAYSWVARFGGALFLVFQMAVLLDFAHLWNDYFVSRDDNRWLVALLVVTLGLFGLSLGGLVYLYVTFHPAGAGDCSRNVFFVTMTLLTSVLFSALSLHPRVENGSIFPSAIMTAYGVFLCYSALSSSPEDDVCNGLQQALGKPTNTVMAGGMLLTLLSVVYSAVRLGSTSQPAESAYGSAETTEQARTLLAPDEMEVEREAAAGSDGEDGAEAGIDDYTPVSYNYTFFHGIYCLASMYFAMLMTGWASSEDMDENKIDVGVTSMWMKIASQWAMSLLYVWSLMAPIAFPDRDFS